MTRKSELRGVTWDTCLVCDKDITLKINGTLRPHGPLNCRCEGSGQIGQKLWSQLGQ